MRWVRAILLGVMLYALIFADISVLMFTPPLASRPAVQTVIHLILLPFWVLVCSYLYFKDSKKSVKEGFWFGVVMLITGTVLDFVITIPLFILPKGAGFFDFYKTWSIWVGFAETLVFTMISGIIFGRGKEKK